MGFFVDDVELDKHDGEEIAFYRFIKSYEFRRTILCPRCKRLSLVGECVKPAPTAPSPEENVERRPGKDTVCGVCGETLRWVERKFPELSGWEECRFHLAAPGMFETLSTIASGQYAEGEERAMAQAATAKASGKVTGSEQDEFLKAVLKMAGESVKECMDVATVAWRAGVTAYTEGKRRDENPVRAEGADEETARLAWEAGWDAGKVDLDHRLLTIGGVDSSFTYYPLVQDIAALPENAEEHDARWVESEGEPYVYSAKRGAWESAEDHVKADEAEARSE